MSTGLATEHLGSLDRRSGVARQLQLLTRAGWSLAFVALFFVLGLADLDLLLELAAAAATGVAVAAFGNSERRREEDAFARRLGANLEASRFARTRARATHRVPSYGECVTWLVVCAFVGYAAAQAFS